MNILEIGCGDFPVYPNSEKIDHRGRGRSNPIDIIMDDLPYLENTFDLVLLEHVIEHIYRWKTEEVLAKILFILVHGGKLVVKCPNIKAAAIAYVNNDFKWFERIRKVNLSGPTGTLGEKFMKFCVSPGGDSFLYSRNKKEIGGLAHIWGWDDEQLKLVANTVGFSQSLILHNPKKDFELHMELVK